jgi:hypothetical protein
VELLLIHHFRCMKTKLIITALVVALITCIAITACAQKLGYSKPPRNNVALLEEAYRTQSKEKLAQFFREWSINIPAISGQELSQLNARQKEAYAVFAAFYKPHRLDRLGGSEWGTAIYQKVGFLLVQNAVKIHATDKIFYADAVVDSIITSVVTRTVQEDSTKHRLLKKVNGRLSQDIRAEYGFETPFSFRNFRDTEKAIDSIDTFRPVIKVPGKQAIYLTPKREETLKAFLGDKHLPLGTGGVMNPARSSGESDKRKKFLENAIKIWYGHWGGYWQLNSYPVASSITFDKNLLYARINFRMVYEGGEAILKKTNGQWMLISSRLTWIE